MNKSLGMSWDELRAEIFTPEDIRASKERIAPIIAEINGDKTIQPDYFRHEMELLTV